jgi:2-hydroxy-4-carboxymuconate semialdehyde hemiacetal dehydrogenase
MVNVCMVGTGSIATQHMRAFRQLGGVRPLWVISRAEDKAREFAREWNFVQHNIELDAALVDPKVELVIIASPSEQHAEQTLRSLRARKHVIVEIPAALALSDSQRIADEAMQRRRRVLVCHTMRSFPAIREVRRKVQAGALNLTQVVGYFGIPRRRNQGMTGQQRNWIDNLLWHHGCHMVDVAMWVLDVASANHVGAILGRPHQEFGMAMGVSIHYRTSESAARDPRAHLQR